MPQETLPKPGPPDSATDEAAILSLMRQLIDGLLGSGGVAQRALKKLWADAPAPFYRSALRLLESDEDSPGLDYLVTLLMENDLLVSNLCDPAALNAEQAVRLAKRVLRVEPALDRKLIRRVSTERSLDPYQADRILALVSSISTGTRALSLLVNLASHHNARIRSKVTSLIGRNRKDAEWLELRLADRDARVRANAIDSVTEPNSETIREVLWKAAKDSHQRVVGSALLTLYRAGEIEAVARLEAMAQDASDSFRASAAWAMGQTGDSCFLDRLTELAKAHDPVVRRNALRALVRVRKPR